jgi:subtilisin family serine protease
MPPELIPEHARESPSELVEDVRADADVHPDAPGDDEVVACEAVRSLEPTGRGVRIAVIDSGVFATHPHIGGVAGGVAIALDGSEHSDFVDRLGHGTAVTAAIKEKAADAEIYAVKVFDRALSTNVTTLVRAIEWAARWDIKLVNLSLGTQRAEHEPALAAAVAHAARFGVIIVAADSDETSEGERVRWLPGSLPGVISVIADWECPRETFRVVEDEGSGRTIFRASPYPRPVPGVPPARNLKGISFAVANMTGFVARVLESAPAATIDDMVRLLRAATAPTAPAVSV